MRKDHYSILGVSKDASADDIKKAFRDLAKKWHPDHNPNNKKEAEEKFKEISEAYEVLSNEDRRRAWDSGPSEPGFGFGGFGDMFARQRAQPIGRDIRGGVVIDFVEAITGCSKTVGVQRVVLCKDCSGSGTRDGKMDACPICDGAGFVMREHRAGFYSVMMQSTCSQCGGLGHSPENACDGCGGRSYVRRAQDITVDVPAGISNNSVLRVAGYGDEGAGGPGDLYVLVRVAPHPLFSRDGNDLLTTKPVSLTLAIAGGETSITGVLGDQIKVRIPKGCQPGQEIRVSGAGVQGGDLRIQAAVVIPVLPEETINKLKEILP